MLPIAALLLYLGATCPGQSLPNMPLEEILRRTGLSVQAYFDGMFSIACTETLERQPLDSRLMPTDVATLAPCAPKNGRGSGEAGKAPRVPSIRHRPA